MRNYEVLFIVKPTLTDDEVKTKVDFVKEIITKNGGEIASVIEMGATCLTLKAGCPSFLMSSCNCPRVMLRRSSFLAVRGPTDSCASRSGSSVVSAAFKRSLMSFCMIRDPCSWVASKVEYPQEEFKMLML